MGYLSGKFIAAMPALKNNLRRLFFALLLFILQRTTVHAQVYGCKDPAANNYNSSATVNDGSCVYTTTNYTPPVKADPISDTLIESSGLQWAGGSLWSFNDGGGAAAIYRVDTTTGFILQTVNLGGATNVDWEDIAFDGTSFYVGDFGNNNTGIRQDLKIYKFPLSAIAADYSNNPVITVPSNQIEVINFSYSDQTDFSTPTSNNTKFDCEAMLIDGGSIHLFSKNWVNTNTTHYVINAIVAGTYVATPLETLATGYLVTAADKSPNGKVVMLLGYQVTGFGSHFFHVLSDYSGGFYFNGNKRRIDLPDATVMGQAEGLAFMNNNYGFVSNEKFTRTSGSFTLTVNQKLRTFNTAGFVPAYVLPVDLTTFTAQAKNGEHIISWRFASPVNELQLLHSRDGIRFTSIQSLGSTSVGSFVYQPFSNSNCYKLTWKQTNGADKYSNVVCLNDKVKTGFNYVVLRKSGELSFVMNANEADDYVFKLLSVDGKLLAQTTQRITAAGYHTVRFKNEAGENNFVLVQITGTKTQYARMIRVQE